MRLATVVDASGSHRLAIVADDRVLPVADGGVPGSAATVRAIAKAGQDAVASLLAWAYEQRDADWLPHAGVRFGPAVPDPGAIYTVGDNYLPRHLTAEADAGRPGRPLIYGKAANSVAGDGAVVSWDRALTSNVDAEVELGVVIGEQAWRVSPDRALRHVFGYTIVNDVSSRDAWLDGDQWLLGKSLPGFCPVGPWVVTADELDASDLALGCRIAGEPIQEGRTSQLRFAVADIVAYLSHHVRLEPGDLIATGTPSRLPDPPGPDRHLEPGDVVTCWIEGIGDLTIRVA